MSPHLDACPTRVDRHGPSFDMSPDAQPARFDIRPHPSPLVPIMRQRRRRR